MSHLDTWQRIRALCEFRQSTILPYYHTTILSYCHYQQRDNWSHGRFAIARTVLGLDTELDMAKGMSSLTLVVESARIESQARVSPTWL